MRLTDDESRRLDEIGSALRRSDPRLARVLRSGPAQPRWARSASVCAFGTAVPAEVVGVGLHVPVLCSLGWFAALIGVSLRCVTR